MKKTDPLFILFLLAFGIITNISSQSLLKNTLKEITTDSLISLIKNNIKSNSNLSKLYAQKIIDRGHKNNNLGELIIGRFHLGLILQIEGNYTIAISNFEKALIVAKEHNDLDQLMKIHLINGRAYFVINNNEKAIFNYKKTIAIAQELKNREYEILGNLNIASIKKRIGQFEEALIIEKENIEIAKEIHFTNPATHSRILFNLGSTYLNLKKPDSAIFYCKQALDKSIAINDSLRMSYSYNILGASYYDKKDYKSSLDYYFKALPIIKVQNNNRRRLTVNYLISRSYFSLKEYDKALIHLKKAEEFHLNNNKILSQELINTYRLLAEVYSIQNDQEKSNYYLLKYTRFDSINDQKNTRVIGSLYTTELKEKKVQLQQAAIKESKYIQFLIIGLILILGISFVLFILFKRAQKNKKLFQELVDTRKGKQEIQTIVIDDDKTKKILSKLEKIEKQEYFLRPEFGLNQLARKLKTNPTYLSKIINTYKEKRFTDYTNELRINYALNRLKEDTKFRSYSILHIAKELGYKSQDSFSRHFKKTTGINPSYYISNIEKLKS